MARKRINVEIKAEILQKLLATRCKAKDLAKEYKISRETIWKWRRKLKQPVEIKVMGDHPQNNSVSATQDSVSQSCDSASQSCSFVELSVSDSKTRFLKQVSLVFNDVSLNVEGKISSDNLLSILKILEIRKC